MSVSPAGPRQGQNATQTAAAETERDARDRIQRAQRAVAEAERDADFRMDGLKDEYVRQYSTEELRQEERFEAQKNKGYKVLSELKKNQEKEIGRVRREGEREFTTSKNYYRDGVYNTEKQGEQKLAELKQNTFLASEYEKKRGADEAAMTSSMHAQRLENLRTEQDQKLTSITHAAKSDHERLKANMMKATEESADTFQAKFRDTKSQQAEVISNLNERASRQIEGIRKDTSQKLDAYSERQSDPFYKMVNVNASLQETKNAFVLTAVVPPHERERISVSVKGDQVVLSGHRRNEEKLEVDPGHTQSTSSYQSYSESFPINWPVDARRLSREFDGDVLIVNIPKKTTYERTNYKAKKVERARMERPQFPGNLPVAQGPAQSEESEAPPVSKKTKGSRPLG